MGNRTALCWLLPVLLVYLCPSGAAEAQIAIEYVAHACFVLQSPMGQRIVLDPFNSHIWLGYSFPDGIVADAVLVTHPHYDHDASYYIGGNPAVFRDPGDFSIGDIQIRGFPGRHADPYGEEFGQINTVWVVEIGGLRLAHLGDNGPLTEELTEQIGTIDLLMIPIDGDQHILKNDEVAAILEALQPRLVLPMHYQLPSLSTAAKSLGPIDPWLEGRENVRRLTTSRLLLKPEDLPHRQEILVMEPSASVAPWGPEFKLASSMVNQARELLQEEPSMAERLGQEAVELYPWAIRFWSTWGAALAENGRPDEATSVLERGLAVASRDDWVHVHRARARLARLYQEAGKKNLAATQHRLILEESRIIELREEADKGLHQPK